MKSSKRVFTLLFVCIFIFKASATTYYFSNSIGNDQNSFEQAQDPSTPWQTISHLNKIFNHLEPNDTIAFKRGETFQGTIHVIKGGQRDQPIIFSAYGSGAKPKISGFKSVNNWTYVGDGIYESEPFDLYSDLNMVVINGINYAMGRWPNPEGDHEGYLLYHDFNESSIFHQELLGAQNWTGAKAAFGVQPIAARAGPRCPMKPAKGQDRIIIKNSMQARISLTGSILFPTRHGFPMMAAKPGRA